MSRREDCVNREKLVMTSKMRTVPPLDKNGQLDTICEFVDMVSEGKGEGQKSMIRAYTRASQYLVEGGRDHTEMPSAVRRMNDTRALTHSSDKDNEEEVFRLLSRGERRRGRATFLADWRYPLPPQPRFKANKDIFISLSSSSPKAFTTNKDLFFIVIRDREN